MGLVELASNNSVWRGLDYYNDKKVMSWAENEPDTYDGIVAGRGQSQYQVHIDKQHPRKSSCTCPFAAGRRVICKHMIALYFTAEPKAAKDFLEDVKRWEAEEEERERRHAEDMMKYVKSLSKKELQEKLYEALMELEERRNAYW